MNTCRWVISPASTGVSAVYCDHPVAYTMPTDDDGNKYRKYKTFCAEHQLKAAKEEQSDDDCFGF